MRILSGIQPSGRPHIGNYFSMMKRMVEYQKDHELFAFIASYHAMTTVQKAEELREGIINIVIDFLAIGMDPNKSTFWVQSDVPQVTELCWILSNFITVNQLELAHSYKDKIAQGIKPNAGLFFYPVLMAADILAFKTEKVPVGKDQKQHLEFTRDIAERFNRNYGEILCIPEPDINEEVAVIPGVDGRKMSKSYKNAIYFFDDEKNIKKQVFSIVTDSKGINEPKDPDTSVLYQIYSLFLNEEEKKVLRDRFLTPGTGYGQLKQELFEKIMDYFADARKKREDLEKRPNDIRDILKEGATKARAIAEEVLQEIREKTGLRY
ncbi:MAG: tryptophan--tRNA ligase [Leptospiraceae bacterium]|nr:tryptophan--tRNA ligase [Leptospiraceae bacterium]MDW7976642.1 tryptophan--tRNA ligase [Leptospiraceae bacterium]